ncbi:hypothetical protein ACVU7I_03125 [Patulibacter sp. S7RM1-6]
MAFVLLLLHDAEDLTTGEAVARVGITLSVLALAGFLGRIAGHERRDARSWTHMDLQLSTSRAFIEGIDEGDRSDVQAALALRFFPGQSIDPHGENRDTPSSDDTMEVLRTLRETLRKPST